MAFPSPPWRMRGQLWLTLVRSSGGPGGRTPGVYGVALVDYQPGSVLTYGELLVARPVKVSGGPDAGRHVTVTDIWVDSEESIAGGRSLWAIPKELAQFSWTRIGHRVPGGLEATVRTGSDPIASARFSAPRLLPPRVPFSGSTWQPREDGRAAVARLQGSSRSFPVRGRWDFDVDGPLGWLREARPLASVLMHDFRLTFG